MYLQITVILVLMVIAIWVMVGTSIQSDANAHRTRITITEALSWPFFIWESKKSEYELSEIVRQYYTKR